MFGTDMLLNLGYELDQPRAVLYADHHDDMEIPDMEDIPSPIKRKAKGKKKKELEERERKAVEEVEHLVAKPTWIGSYKQMYEDYKRQDTIEAKIVNYMDK
jgi:5'-deoxynucleotidase YfbR-like HD superfamily hydrolase